MTDSGHTAGDLWAEAARLFEAGEHDRAVALGGVIAGRFPGETKVHSFLGTNELLRGNLDAAVSHFLKAASLAPHDATVWLRLGDAFKGLGETAPATEAYLQSVSLDPQSPWAHVMVFRHFIDNLKDRDGPGWILERWIEVFTGGTRLEDALARLHRVFGGFDDRHFGPLFVVLSRVLLSLERWEEAVEAFAKSTVPVADATAGEAKDPGTLQTEYGTLSGSYDATEVARLCALTLAGLVGEVADTDGTGRLLDAACGTGLMGYLLRDRFANMVGVDLSFDMLAEAGKKGVYDELVRGDISVALEALGGSFDLITCCDALYHLSDLSGFFAGAASRLAPGGMLALSADPCTDEWEVRASMLGGFAHSRRYLRRLAAENGLGEVEIRIREHRAYPGFYCAFRKQGRKEKT